jgi:hypothetical protein
MIKAGLKVILVLTFVICLAMLSSITALFFKPTLILNKDVLDYGLRKTDILKEWSWKKAEISHKWIKWNERGLKGDFRQLCLIFANDILEVNSCLDKLQWSFIIRWSLTEGFELTSVIPLRVQSAKTNIKTFKSQGSKTSDLPPDIWNMWRTFWGELTPDLDINFSEIKIIPQGQKEFLFDLDIAKNRKKLIINSLGFLLEASPHRVKVQAPQEYSLPFDIPTNRALLAKDLVLEANVSEQDIKVKISGLVGPIDSIVHTRIDLPVQDSFSSPVFLQRLILATKGRFTITGVKDQLLKYGPSPYQELPAPLNVLDGNVYINLDTRKMDDAHKVAVLVNSEIDLSGEKQSLKLILNSEIPFDLSTLSPGSINLGVDLQKVVILMPRLSKKKLPPQFIPDSRFIVKSSATEKRQASKKTGPGAPFDLSLEALGNKALSINSNLLDEPLRLNFDLKISEGKIQKGFLQVLPLKTTVFKRPISVPSINIVFNHPLEPVLKGSVDFLLPEYKISLNLEGPVSDPRYSFESEPPLPQNDIYAVLLFGRPLSELGPDDKNSAQKTNQILAQGILSLSVLYFLAGSPVESIGYDPDSSTVSAQFGLGQKSSLRVGSKEGGGSTAAVRRSLGKGWYLDTSVQNTQGVKSSDDRDYGVLLERVIAY